MIVSHSPSEHLRTNLLLYSHEILRLNLEGIMVRFYSYSSFLIINGHYMIDDLYTCCDSGRVHEMTIEEFQNNFS